MSQSRPNKNTKSLQTQPLDVLVQVLLADWWLAEVLIIGKFFFGGLGHLKGGLEDVDAVEGCADQHLEVDWVVCDFLDFFLALVQEHQLVGYIWFFFLVLDGHVPNGESVVFAGHCDH